MILRRHFTDVIFVAGHQAREGAVVRAFVVVRIVVYAFGVARVFVEIRQHGVFVDRRFVDRRFVARRFVAVPTVPIVPTVDGRFVDRRLVNGRHQSVSVSSVSTGFFW